MRMTIQRVAVLCGAASVAAVSHAQTVEWLHNDETDRSTTVNALSHDGSAAVGSAPRFSGPNAHFHWTRSEGRANYTHLPTGERIFSITHISPDGLTYAGTYDGSAWSGTGAMVRLPATGEWYRIPFWNWLHDAGSIHGLTNNANALLLGDWTHSRYGGYTTFVYYNGLSPAGVVPDSQGDPIIGGMPEDGSFVAYSRMYFIPGQPNDPGRTRAYVWAPWMQETMLTRLTDDPLEDTHALRVSGNGQVILGSSRYRIEGGQLVTAPVKWVNGEISVIAQPEGQSSSPQFINYDGSLLANNQYIWLDDAAPVQIDEYFLVRHGITLPTGTFRRLDAMSADGTTFAFSVQIGTTANRAAFLITVPAPASGLLVLAGVVCAARRRR